MREMRCEVSLKRLVYVMGFLHLVIQAMAILDPLDYLALQSIKKGLEDMPGSSFFSNWDFTSDPCNFAGVLCDNREPNKVVALNLGDSRAGSPGLLGKLDPSIGKLSSLMELTIVPGRITGQIPNTLNQCKNLQFLGISKNFLSGPIPTNLAELTKLQTLDLSYNQLSGSIPQPLGGLPNLSNFILCHNKLTGSVPPLFSPYLSRVDLKHNDLTGTLPSLPSSLQYLSVSWNRLGGNVNQILSRLERLDYLDLSMNRFTGEIPGAIFSFPISSIQLQRNAFTGLVIPIDQVMIPTVDLSYNMLTGHISPLFSTVQNLYLNNNRFTGQVPGSFIDRLLASGIQILYLQHNYLTGIDLNPSATIPLSTSLCIQYNCMVPPVETPCPVKAGKQKTRPASQCNEIKS